MPHIFKNPALKVRDFRTVLTGQSISSIALSGQEIAIAWVVLEITNSPLWVGIALALCEIPSLIFGLPLGSLADRFDRSKLLKFIECIHASIFLTLGILTITGNLSLWHLLILGFATGSVRCLQEITRLTLAYDMVTNNSEVSALSLVHISNRAGTFVGFLLVGSVMERVSLEAAYFSLSVLSLISFIILFGLKPQITQVNSPKDQLGLRFFYKEVRKNARLKTLLVTTAVLEILGFSFATALPFITRDILNLGPEALGLLHAAGSIGGTLALVILISRGDAIDKAKIYLIAIILMAIFILALAHSQVFLLVLLAILCIESVAVTCDVMSQALIQDTVPEHMRGRAMGAWVLAIGTLPIGQIEMGLLIGMINVSGALSVNAFAIFFLVAYARFALKKSNNQ